MKKNITIIWICAILLIACETEKSNQCAIKLPESKVDHTQMEIAAKFASEVCKGWQEDDFNRLDSDRTTPELAQSLTPEKQEQIFVDQIFPVFGRFGQLYYKEAYSSGNKTIFRFKGAYEKGTPEIRVVIDKNDKVAGFWIRPWIDELS